MGIFLDLGGGLCNIQESWWAASSSRGRPGWCGAPWVLDSDAGQI